MLGNEMQRQLEGSDILFRDVAGFVVFNQVEGDYLEFGVFKGDSLVRVHQWMQTHWEDFRGIGDDHGVSISLDFTFLARKRFFAFDSFEGLPTSSRADTPIHFAKGTYSCGEAECRGNIGGQGGPTEQLVTVKGWFSHSLNAATIAHHEMKKASLIFIDCDLFEAAVEVFEFITPLIHDGTVILMDDFFRYRGHPRRGVQGAFNAWRQKHPSLSVAELARCGANRVAFVCNTLEK